jgi:hypothetical protein
MKLGTDVYLDIRYFGLRNNSTAPVLFTVQFRILDGGGNVLDLGYGDGTNWTWIPAARLVAGQYIQLSGPYQYNTWSAGFLRNWDRIAFIQGIRTVELSPYG